FRTIDHRTGINFDLSEGDLMQQHELFKQVCSESINILSELDDPLFVDQEEDDDSFFPKPVIEREFRRNYDSDSDEDISPLRINSISMDVDPWSPPEANSSNDPWGSVNEEVKADNTGWADFSSAKFDNFEQADRKNATETKKPDTEQQKKQSAAKTDLKLKNLEINSNIVEANELKKISNESIETIAQVAKDSLEEKKLLEASGDQAKTDACTVPTVKEMPLVGATKDGDTVPAQTDSSEEAFKQTAVDITEPNKEGV
ncbi:hypothetical protein AMK59_7097, partial [Oryctes borbonicus]